MPTTYYVRKTGSDGAAGTSPGTAFLTWGKAATSVSSGDTVWLGAGIYREVNSLSTANVTWNGDVDGAQTGDAGDVVFSAYLTNDKTAPSASNLVNLNGKSGQAYSNILFIGGSASGASCFLSSTGVTGPNFTLCDFIGYGNATVNSITGTSTSSGLKYDRCSVLGGGNASTLLSYAPAASGAADYDCGAQYLNTIIMGTGSCQGIGHSPGAGTGRAGGGLIFGCTILTGSGSAVLVNSGNASGQYPLKVFDTYIRSFTGLSASLKGSIVEDWNVLDCVTPRTSVPIGPNSIGLGTYAPMIETWHSFSVGRAIRPYGEPSASSPLLGFVAQGTTIVTGNGQPTVTDDSTVGTVSWTNPTNANYPDNSSYATCVLTASQVGHYLKFVGYGFALPSTATVTRVAVRYIAHFTGTGGIAGNSIKLVKGGVISGNDNVASVVALTASDVVYEVGGAADLWGLTLLYSDINAATFGFVLSLKDSSGVNAATADIDYGTVIVEYTDTAIPTEQTQDFRSGPRPAGGASANIACGAFERANTMVRTSSPVHGGSFAGSFTGPGYQDFSRNVDSSPTTISVYAQYDASYGAGTLPQLIVLANGQCGVTQQTATQVGASGSYEKITTPSFTPTGAGRVTVRLISHAAPTGVVEFDDAGT